MRKFMQNSLDDFKPASCHRVSVTKQCHCPNESRDGLAACPDDCVDDQDCLVQVLPKLACTCDAESLRFRQPCSPRGDCVDDQVWLSLAHAECDMH